MRPLHNLHFRVPAADHKEHLARRACLLLSLRPLLVRKGTR